MEKWIKKIMQFGGLFLFMSCNQPVDVVTIDLSREEAEIPPSLYGIFFEEITHSGDGGLYAEMIRNRGFEDGTLPSGTVLKDGKAVAKPLHCYSNDSINHFSIAWNDSLFMEGWEVKCVSDTRPPFYEITEVKPLNNATPHALFIDLGASASDVWVMNDGYWGIAVTEGQRYNFQFYLFTEELKNTVVTAALLDREDQIVVSKNFQIERDGSWNHYEGAFTVDTTANDLRFALLLPHKGKVYIDFVSMFPENTFCGHKNGLREDVAGMLRDLRPDFVRWPGGCIVKGLTMDNRIKWKETIGDIVKRPGEYNLWGYRSTYGFGYHEFLQFCEDIDADGMFVCNAGMSCLFRNGDYWEEENRIDNLIQEALDAIEYALGDTTTVYGKRRAENGHAAPFPLKYVEVGNENVGLRYVKNYNRFYKAIKEKYPEMIVVGTVGPFNEGTDYVEGWKLADKLGIPMVDEHYYQTPGWFLNNQDFYDKYDRSKKTKVYLGEYATHIPGRKANIETALTEALYLAALERNGDVVHMTSYAPLLAKEGHTQWNPDLIYFNNREVKPTTGYYVQKLYGQNAGNEYLPSKITLDNRDDQVRKRIAASIVRDSASGDVIVKLVNLLSVEVNTNVDLSGIGAIQSSAKRTVLTGKPADTPLPVEDTMEVAEKFDYQLPAYSFTVIRIKKANEK